MFASFQKSKRRPNEGDPDLDSEPAKATLLPLETKIVATLTSLATLEDAAIVPAPTPRSIDEAVDAIIALMQSPDCKWHLDSEHEGPCLIISGGLFSAGLSVNASTGELFIRPDPGGVYEPFPLTKEQQAALREGAQRVIQRLTHEKQDAALRALNSVIDANTTSKISSDSPPVDTTP